MEENQRFRNVITSLKENKRVRNQQDFLKYQLNGSNLEMANCLIAPLFKPIRMGIISMDSR